MSYFAVFSAASDNAWDTDIGSVNNRLDLIQHQAFTYWFLKQRVTFCNQPPQASLYLATTRYRSFDKSRIYKLYANYRKYK